MRNDQGLSEQCCICSQRIALNLRQHILQSHKGCGSRLLDRTESCGEMFDQCFWLCNQCLSDHEINYSNFCITWNTTTECSVIVRYGFKYGVDVKSRLNGKSVSPKNSNFLI